MKNTHILYLLVFIFTTQLTVKAMETDTEDYRRKEKIPSLAYIAAKSISDRIHHIIKAGLSQNYPVKNIIETVNAMISTLTEPTKDMIRTNLLCKYANRVFRRFGNGKVQYFDGRQISASDRLSPSDPSKVDSYGYWSFWSSLDLNQLIEQYSNVRHAKKQLEQHPYCPITVDDIPALGMEMEPAFVDEEDFVLDLPSSK